MAPRKRKPVHYVSVSFHGEASYSVMPVRKPHKSDVFAQDDPDLVNLEYFSDMDEYKKLPDESCRHVAGILATRINTRRAIRELVLPELDAIKKALAELRAKLDKLLAEHSG